jgi:hypothetical protein
MAKKPKIVQTSTARALAHMRDFTKVPNQPAYNTERYVRSTGIQLLDNYYFSTELAKHIGKVVIVKFDKPVPDSIQVFDRDDKYLCAATLAAKTSFGVR